MNGKLFSMLGVNLPISGASNLLSDLNHRHVADHDYFSRSFCGHKFCYREGRGRVMVGKPQYFSGQNLFVHSGDAPYVVWSWNISRLGEKGVECFSWGFKEIRLKRSLCSLLACCFI